jgi:teichuronic acid biosynthesis glycosyltransferase TuaG
MMQDKIGSKKENSALAELPLVSVIIPMFNASPFIAETIESVLSQSYRNWEVYIIDNCSTDSSRQVVDHYVQRNKRINLLSTEFNSGSPARPRNLGLKNAKGKYIAFLDADDLWCPDKLEKQVSFLEVNPEVFLLYAKYRIIRNGRITGKIMPKDKYLFSGKIFKQLFLSNNFIPCVTAILRNRFEHNYLFDEQKCFMEDFDLWLRISQSENIAFIRDPLAIYRADSGGFVANAPVFIAKYLSLLKKWSKRVEPSLMATKYFFFSAYLCAYLLRNFIFHFNRWLNKISPPVLKGVIE